MSKRGVRKVLLIVVVAGLWFFDPTLLFYFVLLSFCLFMDFNVIDEMFSQTFTEDVEVVGKIAQPTIGGIAHLLEVSLGKKGVIRTLVPLGIDFRSIQEGDFVTVRYSVGRFSKLANGGMVL